jgi:hypothetical protein
MAHNKSLRQQSEIAQMFLDKTRPYLAEIKKIQKQLEEHMKIKTDRKVTETDEHLMVNYDQTILALSQLTDTSTNVVGLNRVVLNGGNPDQNNYGVYDGWPGTYWIELANQISFRQFQQQMGVKK